MITRDMFQRELAGEVIALSDPEYPKIGALITDAYVPAKVGVERRQQPE